MSVELEIRTNRWLPVVIGAFVVAVAIGTVVCLLAVSSRTFSVGALLAVVLTVSAAAMAAAAPLLIAALMTWRRPLVLLVAVPMAWLLSAKAWFLLVDLVVLKALQGMINHGPHNYREALYILLTDEGVGMPMYGLASVAMILVVTSVRMSKAPRVAVQALTLVVALLFAISCFDAAGLP